MSLPPKETLGALRDKLAARLGFGAQIGNLGALDTILKSFLQDAQDFLWRNLDVPELQRDVMRRLGVEQFLYDYPDDCAPERILAVSVQFSQSWRRLTEMDAPLNEEITEAQVGNGNTWTPTFPLVKSRTGTPAHYERREQLRIWPVPLERKVLRLTYQKRCDPFTQDQHRSTLDSMLIFRLALADAKSHYKHPDAQKYQERAAATLRKLKVSEHGERRYSLLHGDVSASPGRGDVRGDPYSRPVTRGQME